MSAFWGSGVKPYEKCWYSQAAGTVVSSLHWLWALRSQCGEWLNSNSSSEIAPSYNCLELHKTKSLHRHQGEQDLLVSLPLHGLAPLHTWSMGRLGLSCSVHGHCVCIYPQRAGSGCEDSPLWVETARSSCMKISGLSLVEGRDRLLLMQSDLDSCKGQLILQVLIFFSAPCIYLCCRHSSFKDIPVTQNLQRIFVHLHRN